MSETDFLLDTSEDDNVRIHRHTNRKDDTGHTRKCQSDIKCSQHDEYQANIQSQSNDSSHTRDKVNHHHEYSNNRKADGTCL